MPFGLTWTGINISSCAYLEFSGKFAESGWRGTDLSDFVIITATIDGGLPSTILQFTANGDGNNDAFAVDADFDFRGEGTALQPVAQTFTVPIVGTGSLLDLKILMKIDASGED
eukprot:2421072-Prymnesium_polylepis.1